MTRREWLQRNPPPKTATTLPQLLGELQAQARTPEITSRIAALEKEIANCAQCPTHRLPLQRHNNRPEDLFVCPTGPHFFLWTKVGPSAAFSGVKLSDPLPDLDKKLEWM
jgi:hypothetical protein